MKAHRYSHHRVPLWGRVSIGLVSAALVVSGSLLAVHSHLALTASASTTPRGSQDSHGLTLSVTSVTPPPGSSGIAPDISSIQVTFSEPLAADSPTPTFTPSVSGTWDQPNPNTLRFTPTESLIPGSTLTLTIPGGSHGILAAGGERLATSLTSTWTVAPGSYLRVQQLLATLGYLPLTFTPATQVPPVEMALPQQGSFAWKWPNTPPSLQALWTPGQPNLITKGAIMTFEEVNHLTTDGLPGPQVWTDLLNAVYHNQVDPHAYTYIYVSKVLPENLTLWRNGAVALTSLANTGVPASPTPDGTWPIYLRLTFQIMRGVNPNGTKYADPVHWINYFYESDAVHGFQRAAYGFPQSVGCVELPIPVAAKVWSMVHIGTLVTVS